MRIDDVDEDDVHQSGSTNHTNSLESRSTGRRMYRCRLPREIDGCGWRLRMCLDAISWLLVLFFTTYGRFVPCSTVPWTIELGYLSC